jgi:hypothetical protein
VWSNTREGELASLCRRGASVRYLADHFDRTEAAIKQKLGMLRARGIDVDPLTVEPRRSDGEVEAEVEIVDQAELHGELCLAAGGFPALAEREWFCGGERRTSVCLPLTWPGEL